MSATRAFTSSMNASDTTLWMMERDPELRSTVTAVALLDAAPDRQRLRRRVEQAVEVLPRLGERVSSRPLGLGRPRWVPDPGIDLDYHLQTVRAADGDTRWVLDFAAVLAEGGFDRDRPLWQLVVVEGLEGGRAALVQKVHHALTDGVGAFELMLWLVDASRFEHQSPGSRPLATAMISSGDPLWKVPAIQATKAVVSAAGLLRAVGRAAARPPDALVGTARAAVSLARLIAPTTKRCSPILVGRSTRWHFDVTELPLVELHRSAHALDATINDVFVAAMAGALHRYHAERGHEVATLRINLPVSFRRPGDPLGGNRFTPVRFTLPVDELDPAQRVRQIKLVSRRWRSEPALGLTETIAGVVSLLPPAAVTAVMGGLLRGVDFVATNVPGLEGSNFVAGAELLREFAFSPLSGAALNATLISHGETACIGVNTDRAAVPDPEILMSLVEGAFAEIVALGRPGQGGGRS